ncbi:MAG TPA: hypothetical protein VGE77_10130 [Nocardioides sp.]
MPSRTSDASRRGPVEPAPSRGQVVVALVGAALVALVLVGDAAGVFEDNRTVGVVLAIAGAAVTAGITYSFWGGAPARTIRMHAALLAAMVGGFAVVTSSTAQSDGVFGHVALGGLGLAGLLLAVVALLAQARVAGLPHARGGDR